MKWVRRSLLGALLLLLAGAGAVALLLGTSDGLGWLARQADAAVPGRLTVGSIQGGLFGRLRLTDVRYEDQTMATRAEEIVLRWQPRELLRGRFHLVELTVNSPVYSQLAPAQSDESSEPLALPDLALPVALRLDRVEITDLRVVPAPGAEPVTLDRLLLSAAWTAQGITVKTLELEMPGVAVAANGSAQPIGAYPLELNTRVTLTLPEAPKLQARGAVRGDLDTLTLEQQVSGDISATLSGRVEDPLGALNWQAELDLDAFALQSVAPDIEGTLGGRLGASGNLQRVNAEGEVLLRDAADFRAPWRAEFKVDADLAQPGITVDHLTLTRPDTPLRLQFAGQADADLNVDLSGQWQALQWPPVGAAALASEEGRFELDGNADDYRLTLSARIAGTDVPAGAWEIEGHGDRERFNIERLEGRTLDGTVSADGRVAWAPVPSWEAALRAGAVNPGVQYPQWPGRLDLSVSSKGTLEDGRPQLSLVIDTLSGNLRDRPLQGTGTVRMSGERIELDDLRLASGAARVGAHGALGEASDLSWSVAIDDLADVLPGAGGSIEGEGTVSGPMTTPYVQADLSAGSVSYQDLALRSLTAEVALDVSDRQNSSVSLQAADLRAGGQPISALRLRAEGRMTDHRLSAQLDHEQADLLLQLSGAFDQDAETWRGSVKNLQLESAQFGDWGLRQPARIVAGADDVRLEPLCLTREAGSVCASADLEGGSGKTNMQAEGLQLAWLRELLPPAVERLEGAIGVRADVTLGDVPLVDARLDVGPGEVIVHPPLEDAIELRHQGGGIEVLLDRDRLVADLNLALGEDGIKGGVEIPRPALDEEPASAPVNGEIILRFRQLGLLSGLLPMVEKLSGELRAEVNLGGTLGQPDVQGQLTLDMPQVQIPAAGLNLQDLSLQASSADGRNIRLDGGLISGPGRLAVSGDLELDEAKNWPMRIEIEGTEFEVLDLPDKTARIATDLAFRSGAEGIVLEGSLDVLHAYIVLKDLPQGAVSASSDVVVTSAESESPLPERGAPFAMQVTVGLSDDVEFRGFGLNAFVEGRLTVTQRPREFPTGSGELHIKEGTYRAYGQDLTIERGIIAYSGGRIDNPGLSIRAAREASVDLGYGPVNVKAGVDVSGTAKKPRLSVFSNPAMEERDAISIMLTGNTADNLGSGGSIGLGTQVTRDLSVGARYDPSTSQTEFVTKYRFNRKFHVETTTSSESNAADVFYSLEFD